MTSSLPHRIGKNGMARVGRVVIGVIATKFVSVTDGIDASTFFRILKILLPWQCA